MAVLEAFVHDPLINWRLVETSLKEDDLLVGLQQDEHAPSLSSTRFHSRRAEEEAYGEVKNERAVEVISRVDRKLKGRDFEDSVALDVPTQVQKLIEQATSIENLCQCYPGWCPFW